MSRSWREPKPAQLSQPVPDLQGAACRRYFSPDFWAAGADEEQREAARHVCLTTLALSMPLTIQGIIAGTGQAERARLSKERRQQAAALREREAARLEARRRDARNSERRRRLLGKAPTTASRYANGEAEMFRAAALSYYAAHAEEVKAKRRARYARQKAGKPDAA